MPEPSEPIHVRTLRELAQTGSTNEVAGFSTAQADGALANGSRVRKVRNDPGDVHTIGDQATVIGSLGAPDGRYFYFVEWDDLPGLPVGIGGHKLAAIEAE